MITIKGVVAKKLYPKTTSSGSDDVFKIYALEPEKSCIDKVDVNIYGNITIKGSLPELLPKKIYEFEVEEVNDKYGTSYNVTKVLTNTRPCSGEEAFVFLCGLTTENRAQNILKVYPDFIDKVINEEELSSKDIKGIGEKTLQSISKKVRSQFVYYDLIVEYKDYMLTMSQIQKIYETYGSVEKVRQKMKQNPYMCLCSVGGIGFKTADVKILNKHPQFIRAPFRMAECIIYVLGQNEVDGNTYMLYDDLYSECKKNTPECMDFFQRALENSDRIYFDNDRNRIAKMATRLCEEEVAKRLLKIKDSNWQLEPYDEGSSELNYTKIGDVQLTDQQQQTIPSVINNNITVLAGYAGAGKSMSCKALINFLEDEHLTYMLLAPTGRAASVLSGYTGRTAMTIHRGLRAKGEGIFEHNEYNKLIVDVVIVDESTMADVYLFKALLRALPDKTKIVFVCDPAQIPSVGAGNVIQDMIRSKVFNTVMLDKVFRYNEGGLSYVATETRQGRVFLSKDNVQEFGDKKDYVFYQKMDEEVVKNAVAKFIELYKSGVDVNDMVVVSCYNKGSYGTYVINNIIQSAINPAKTKNDGKISYTKDGIVISFNIGDKVLMTKNNYHVKVYRANDLDDDECVLYNGDFGIVKYITDKDELICQFGDNIVCIPKKQASDLLLGYSVSCHKMQGDNREHIIFITPAAHTYMLTRNLIYVALTRAKSKVYHYGDIKTVNRALKKSDNLSRKTFLENLLTLNKLIEKSVDNN